MFQIYLMYLFQSIIQKKYKGVLYHSLNIQILTIEMNIQQKIICQSILLEYVKLQQGLTHITRYFVHK